VHGNILARRAGAADEAGGAHGACLDFAARRVPGDEAGPWMMPQRGSVVKGA
jgi:hypothetical protein